MTLDEAIKHCEEIAHQKDLESGFETDNERYAMTDKERTDCKDCAEEHRQLAEWLKELKRQREAWEKVKAEIEAERDDCQIYKLHYAFWDGEDYAYKECLNIIDKHLQEVTTDADSD